MGKFKKQHNEIREQENHRFLIHLDSHYRLTRDKNNTWRPEPTQKNGAVLKSHTSRDIKF